METKLGTEPINPQEPTVTAETVTLTKAELDELKHKADVSSQNYARLKKTEEELASLKQNGLPALSQEFVSDEGKALAAKSESLEREIALLKEERTFDQVKAKFPVIAEKKAEFDEFRSKYPTYDVDNVAKLFLLENGLLEPVRKGLEKPTGGPTQPTPSGMSPEDVASLRSNNYQLYKEKLLSGEIKI